MCEVTVLLGTFSVCKFDGSVSFVNITLAYFAVALLPQLADEFILQQITVTSGTKQWCLFSKSVARICACNHGVLIFMGTNKCMCQRYGASKAAM